MQCKSFSANRISSQKLWVTTSTFLKAISIKFNWYNSVIHMTTCLISVIYVAHLKQTLTQTDFHYKYKMELHESLYLIWGNQSLCSPQYRIDFSLIRLSGEKYAKVILIWNHLYLFTPCSYYYYYVNDTLKLVEHYSNNFYLLKFSCWLFQIFKGGFYTKLHAYFWGENEMKWLI